MVYTIEQMKEKAYEMRKRFLEVFTLLGFGHVTSAFSETEILIALYYSVMNFKVDNPDWADRDRFVLSKGHGAGMLFPIFEDLGMLGENRLEDLVRLGADNSVFSKFFLPGFEFYGGSLGIGLGMAAGIAKGAKLSGEKWKTYCLVGDAESYEGSIWEAAIFAGANELNNLVVIVDRNKLGCSNFTEKMLALEPYGMKWEACGFRVVKVNGHSIGELITALKNTDTKKPLCVIAETVKGKGIDSISNQPLMHGFMPSKEDLKTFLDELY